MGNDVLWAAAGTTRSPCGEPSGEDVIHDLGDLSLADEQDIIELFGDFSFSNLTLTASDNNVVITESDVTSSITSRSKTTLSTTS